jgi:hypothetical protein
MPGGGRTPTTLRSAGFEPYFGGFEEWLSMEAVRLPDPTQLDLIAGVLGLTPEQTGMAVHIHRLAWTA